MKFRILTSILVLVALSCGAWSILHSRSRSVVAPITHATIQQNLELGRIRRVLEQCRAVIVDNPDDVAVILMAAEAAERNSNASLAVDWLNRLPADFSNPKVRNGWLKQSSLLVRLGRITEARHSLETIADTSGFNGRANVQLAKLLCGVGLRYQGCQLLNQYSQHEVPDIESLVILAKNGRRLFGMKTLERWYSLNPDDPLVVNGNLAVAWEARDLADVKWLLNQSQHSESFVRLHRMRLASAISSGADLPDFPDNNPGSTPDSMLLAAQVSRQRSESARTIDILVSVLHLDPWSVEANYSLAEQIRTTHASTRRQLLELVDVLGKIDSLAQAAASEHWRAESAGPDTTDCAFSATAQLVELLTSIGRHREAAAWTWHSTIQAADHPDQAAFSTSSRLESMTYRHPVELLAEKTNFKLQQSTDSGPPGQQQPLNTGQFCFVDVAANSGLSFVWENGATADQQGLKMNQWTGGGVAVIDLDNDTWPDFYFSQGGNLAGRNLLSDRLYRNRVGRQFTDVSDLAAINEVGFGQGVAAGDINNDGFTDLYIGNTGVNRLLINQGDGTFIAETVGKAAWTTSVAVADITGDGNVDFYDVNYLGGKSVFTQTCDHDGRQRICSPEDFPAEPDVLRCSNGEGGFTARIVEDNQTDARGMGLVIGDLNGTGKNLVYIANDESPNQLLKFSDSGDVVQEAGFLAGVALDHRGQAQGSMGIACCDCDNNGHLDLFVTNYYSESNNLFRQIGPGVFTDESASSRLSTPGLSMLGFGCQFIDANSDGFSDLVVANGHLDDFTFQNKPFEMKPQLFGNDGGGSFQELAPSGDYFDRMLLGRAMASLDWNKDGRQDLVVTHVNAPVSLVENRSEQLLSSSLLKLVGTRTTRDPIGASLQFQGRRYWRIAGNGYQCSNEDRLSLVHLTTGDTTDMTIRWPDSTSEIMEASSVAEFVVIQGRYTAYELPQ